MDFYGEQYYKINRLLLSLVGLWPYQEQNVRRVQAIIGTSLIVLSLVTQVAKLCESMNDIDFVLKSLSYIIPTAIYLAKYLTFYLKRDQLILILKRIRDDWSTLKLKRELEIVRKYLAFTRFLTFCCSLFVFSGIIGFLCAQFVPTVLDIIMPLNVTRPRKLPVNAKYFVEQDKYYYPILSHMILMVLFGLTAVVSTFSFLLLSAQHSCAMFVVAEQRIKLVVGDTALAIPALKSDHLAPLFIMDAVTAHRRAIELMELIYTTFSKAYFLILGTAVISLSVNLWRFFQAVNLMNDTDELFTSGVFLFGHYYYMFLCNLGGQMIADHSDYLHEALCDGRWYETTLRTQKLLLFLMQRSIKSYKVRAEMFEASLEGFAQVASTSFSYFTVIYSLR